MGKSGARIVIAGGGLAGHRIAHALQKEAAVTLIDPKDYFEVPMAVPRMLVEPGRARDAIIPYSEFLRDTRLVRSRVVSVRAGSVMTDAGEVDFEYLVLATGAGYRDETIKAASGSAEERRVFMGAQAEAVRGARHIAVVGGGPVGVEIAGEILEDLPGKRLTLVHRGRQLLEALTGRPPEYALQHLRKRGADVLLNALGESAVPADADLVFWCAGYRCDTSYLQEGFGKALTAEGRVLVDEHLRVTGDGNIFAVGDITALAENKLGIWAGKHAGVVVENLRRLMRGRGEGLKVYRPATGNRTMLVTLGRNHGTGHIPPGDFTNSWFARTVKSRDMFIGRYRRGVGLGVTRAVESGTRVILG